MVVLSKGIGPTSGLPTVGDSDGIRQIAIAQTRVALTGTSRLEKVITSPSSTPPEHPQAAQHAEDGSIPTLFASSVPRGLWSMPAAMRIETAAFRWTTLAQPVSAPSSTATIEWMPDYTETTENPDG